MAKRQATLVEFAEQILALGSPTPEEVQEWVQAMSAGDVQEAQDDLDATIRVLQTTKRRVEFELAKRGEAPDAPEEPS